MSQWTRRTVLKYMGIQLTLPFLESLVPRQAWGATLTQRKNFIGVYFPNGSYIPNFSADPNGAWHWKSASGVLSELKPAPGSPEDISSHVMVMRGLHNGISDRDPHWQNVASFLSCKRIALDLKKPQAGQSIDQMIAETKSTYLPSIEIAAPYYNFTGSAHDDYSDIYINRISWKNPSTPITPMTDPKTLFKRLFAPTSGGERYLAYLKSRKKSILDNALTDLQSLHTDVSQQDRHVLAEFKNSIREIELGLEKEKPKCGLAPTPPTLDYPRIDQNYVDRYQRFQEILVFAIKCQYTNVGTIMYSTSMGNTTYIPGTIAHIHHGAAHHQGDQAAITSLLQINRLQLRLFKDLIVRLKNQNLLADTLVIYGSDMSDGNLHLTDNIPFLVAGDGGDLRLGEEVNVGRQPVANLYRSVLSMYGIQKESLGDEASQSTGNLDSLIKKG